MCLRDYLNTIGCLFTESLLVFLVPSVVKSVKIELQILQTIQ